MHTVMYLRKSRADLEAEQSGAGDTLARHRTALTALAERMALQVGMVYEEIVSGDTIAARPQMQRLLKEVEAGLWEGVLVMEIERLARGDPIDQGTVARAFRYSGTKIITPAKIYDPANEFDEEFLEFGLFMSRREYKTIRRRLNAGVQASRREGKYTGSVPPYGYRREKLKGEKGYTLLPDPNAAPIVHNIFDWFVTDGMRALAIAGRLNDMGIARPGGTAWYTKAVTNILRNPHYAGYTTSSRRPCKPTVREGEVIVTRPRSTDVTLYEGRHAAIVPRPLWCRAQEKLKHYETPPVPRAKAQANAFSGILYCAACGARMQRGSYGKASPRKPYIFCADTKCPTVSAGYEDVEALVLTALDSLSIAMDLDFTEYTSSAASSYAQAAAQLQKKHAELVRRETRACELAEIGAYSAETFVARKSELMREKLEIEHKISTLAQTLAHLRPQNGALVPQAQTIAALYRMLDAQGQNRLLKTIFYKMEYKKTCRASAGSSGDLALVIYPCLPPHAAPV